MLEIAYSSRRFRQTLERFCEAANASSAIVESVSKILADVRSKGDRGISATLRRIDGIRLKPSQFSITSEAVEAAKRRLPRDELKAIRESVASVTEFHQNALPKPWKSRNAQGSMI